MKRIKRIVLVLSSAVLLLGGTCAVNARDALVTGAMDFVSGATTDFMHTLLNQVLVPEES